MLFDIGVPYRSIKNHLYGVRYIFITHRHADHFKQSTYDAIRRDFPRIKFIGNYSLYPRIDLDYIAGDETRIDLRGRLVQCFACDHDVPCSGYAIELKDGTKMIYATDTATLDNAPRWLYDYFFVESNHDESKINAVMGNGRKYYGYDVWMSAKRHLSTQKAKAFYYMQRKSKESKWIELHKSSRFY